MGDHWLITDSAVETVSSFEVFAEELQNVTQNPYRWKWAILALHSGLQGMMVLSLQKSHGLHVLKPRDLSRWLEADKRGGPYPKDLELDSFLGLYKKIKSNLMMMYTDSQKFVPKGTQGSSIRRLNKLRNEFVHFTPRVWALDLKVLPAISKDCVKIAEFLAWQSFNVTWAEDDLIRRTKNAFKSAHNSLSTFGDIVKTKKKI